MKKQKLIALLLAIVLVVGCASLSTSTPVSAASVYLAIDDELLPSITPYMYGGGAYLPYTVFARFGIYNSHFENNTISLYNGTRQLYFDLTNGGSYDAVNNSYTASAIYRNGLVYVPVMFCASFFGGFNYSYIYGTYGDIFRLTTGNQQLTDSQFMNAASSALQAYADASTPSPSPTPRPSPSPSPSPRPAPSPSPSPSPTPEPEEPTPEPEEEDRSGTKVYLAVEDISELSDETLQLLQKTQCTFFLTAEQLRENPALARELDCAGCGIGIACGTDPEANFAAAAPLLFEATGIWPTIITCAPGAEEKAAAFAQEEGIALWEPGIDGAKQENAPLRWYTDLISACPGFANVRIAGENTSDSLLSALLQYLQKSKYSIGMVRETAFLE